VATVLPAATAGGKQVQCAAVQLPYRGGEYYAVAAMPVGEFSAEAAPNGQRALATPAGPVPYADALSACRQALLAHLPASGSAPGGTTPAPSQHWRRLPGTDVKVWLPRCAQQTRC
jgi:hypothetical protein